MLQSWRWFGPGDPISLTKIRQAGAAGVVTALHGVPAGEVWSRAAILERKALVEGAGLSWSVVESLPVPSAVRLAHPESERLIERYIESLGNLGELGIRTICYNFMPVIDWTRTDLEWRAPDGSIALRFESAAWVAFDVFLLKRKGAEAEYDQKQLEAGQRHFERLGPDGRERLIKTVAAGLPGANEDGYTLEGLSRELERWQSVTPDVLRARLIAFLEAVVPVCERYDMRLCLHPDDPPRPLLGLPRIASCQTDFDSLFAAVPSPINGLTLCVGSLTAGRHNDASALVRHFAPRIHFAHLRSVLLEDDDSFVEADHLQGDADLVDVAKVLVGEERRRRTADPTHASIAMRPDHGRVLEGDIADLPGYPWLGRLKALAELRGMLHAIEHLT
jgi:mannonate dehydratase